MPEEDESTGRFDGQNGEAVDGVDERLSSGPLTAAGEGEDGSEEGQRVQRQPAHLFVFGHFQNAHLPRQISLVSNDQQPRSSLVAVPGWFESPFFAGNVLKD